MVRQDRGDSRACLARKETRGPEDSPGCQDPSDCRLVDINSSYTRTHQLLFVFVFVPTLWTHDSRIALNTPEQVSHRSLLCQSLHRLSQHFIPPYIYITSRQHHLLEQPRLLISLYCFEAIIPSTPPSPHVTFSTDSSENPSAALMFCIWHFARAAMVKGAGHWVFPTHPNCNIVLCRNHLSAVFSSPYNRPAAAVYYCGSVFSFFCK